MALQRKFKRVMCVDIDVHHGDGTEGAFLHSDSVLTVSFHQLEPGFFPGTGDPQQIGRGKGQGFNVNVGFRPGTSGTEFVSSFRKCIQVGAS